MSENMISDCPIKVLGTGWNSEKDVFYFQNSDIPIGLVPTKRIVLSSTARLYDPLGFLALFTMSLKMLF